MGTTYTATLQIQHGPPVIFNDAPLPPYPLNVGDTVVFQLDSASTSAGWTLKSFALNTSAWYLSSGDSVLLGGAFESLDASTLNGLGEKISLPGTPANFTLHYTTGSSGNGLGFTFHSAEGMQDMMVRIGITLTAQSPDGHSYTSHDPQVYLPPQR